MSSGNLQLPQNSIKAVDAEAAEILRSSGPYAQYGMIESPASTLGDYWRILVKRKWTVIAALLIIVTTVTIASFRMRPIYDAVGRIDITRQSDILNIKDRPVNTEDTDFMMSAETQVRILQSDILALQVARKLHLDEKAGSGARPGSLKEHGSSQELAAREAGLIAMIKAPLKVVTIPGTRLIEIHYQSPDPRMAAEVVNALVQTYIEQNLKTKYESTLQAADWLSKQLADLQIKVETSQEKLVRYQKEHEIVGIDEKQNIITSKLDELNKELTMAQSERIQKQAIYQMAAAGGPESVPTLGNELILKLREQEADLKNQYAQLSTQFGPQYPK
ncbi:MAG TPA: GumC family protein, partial [Burkholderiales bacterium]|nr:GumC family protein [Burkholderiales bacterium]